METRALNFVNMILSKMYTFMQKKLTFSKKNFYVILFNIHILLGNDQKNDQFVNHIMAIC